MINDRLELDCRMTHPHYKTRALSKSLVIQTWEKTLMDEEQLPEDWTSKSGVLVGITGEQRDEVSGIG